MQSLNFITLIMTVKNWLLPWTGRLFATKYVFLTKPTNLPSTNVSEFSRARLTRCATQKRPLLDAGFK